MSHACRSRSELVGLGGQWATLRLWTAATAAAVRTWWRLGRENAELRGLPDRELRDIGVSGADAWAASRQSRWPQTVETWRKFLRDRGVS
jgi:uncharacterized protein YjiS (DUF1127 family)